MSIRGEKFVVDFSDDEDNEERDGEKSSSGSANHPSFAFVGDIVERVPAAPKPPMAPTLKSTTTGFPDHKKRTRISAFKQQRASNGDSALAPAAATAAPLPPARSSQSAYPTNPRSLTQKNGSFEENERRTIDQENSQRLADMSEDEISREREDLLSSLSPSMIEALLKRANLDGGRGDTGWDDDVDETNDVEAKAEIEIENKTDTLKTQVADKKEHEAVPVPQPSGKRITASKTVTFDDDKEPADPGPLKPVTNFTSEAASNGPEIHFPTAPSAPDLDPSDPSFLENLHTKYFPSLPADPSKLAWMAPVPTHGSAADQDSPYYPGQHALHASALRFDFRGALLPPRISRAMPTNRGLHHHGEAPEAAGYTVPELARLARSAFPAQRCIAFQILGRFLYRLGRGDFGDEDNEMTKGLWYSVGEGKVVETLEEAASVEGGHQGSKTYAVEAVWLWQKAGGKKWKAS